MNKFYVSHHLICLFTHVLLSISFLLLLSLSFLHSAFQWFSIILLILFFFLKRIIVGVWRKKENHTKLHFITALHCLQPWYWRGNACDMLLVYRWQRERIISLVMFGYVLYSSFILLFQCLWNNQVILFNEYSHFFCSNSIISLSQINRGFNSIVNTLKAEICLCRYVHLHYCNILCKNRTQYSLI